VPRIDGENKKRGAGGASVVTPSPFFRGCVTGSHFYKTNSFHTTFEFSVPFYENLYLKNNIKEYKTMYNNKSYLKYIENYI
jgi:hypothetical protein